MLVLGASGSGKSTLLRGVAGLLDPETAAETAGTIEVAGVPVSDEHERVGMLLQDPEASLVMSRAGDDVAFGLENAGVPREQIWPRVDGALDHVGFPYGRDRQTHELSGGEQQRLALAGALVREPSVLVLDEPTANLDPDGRELVLKAIHETTAGTAVLMVEHRVADVIDLIDRVVVVGRDGGIVADGRPADVFAAQAGFLSAAGVWVPEPWAPPPHRRPAGTAGDVVLRADALTAAYPGAERPAVAGIDLEVRHGTVTAITGANGSGKSTLAMLLGGLMRPDAGSVHLATAPTRPLHKWRARDLHRAVGTVFQNPEHQFIASTVTGELRGDDPDVVDDILKRLRLDHLAAANPFTLSGGEQRRLSVAAAIATAPDVLILDEPTFGQDAQTWAQLVDLCMQLRDQGTALVTVTHDLTFAGVLADQHIAIASGVITDVG